MTQRPRIGVIQGDPAGIGPELLIKLLHDDEVRAAADVVVIGDPRILARGEADVGKSLDCRHITAGDEVVFRDQGCLHLDLEIEGIDTIPQSQVSAEGGRSSIEGLKTAFELARAERIDGVCFMPFNKQSMHLGGNDFSDELGFARNFFGLTGCVSEFNVAHGMWNGRVTSHVAMKDVPNLLTQERICDSIELADRTLRLAGYERPRIVVAAYNPHAGDGGLMGREEIDVIAPAVEKMQKRQMQVSGPLPADTLWLKVRDGEYDSVVTMYHDQGQIAIKLLGFDQGVSVLAGLPIPVTTPAHGTAYDIAGKNLANLTPAKNAFLMAAQMSQDQRPAAAQ